MISLRSIGVAIVCALWASTALAQTPSQQTTDERDPNRPATNTFSGDTGLWYVPTAEVLEKSEWSAGLYRAGFNYVEGFSNVSDIAGDVRVRRGAEDGTVRFLQDRSHASTATFGRSSSPTPKSAASSPRTRG